MSAASGLYRTSTGYALPSTSITGTGASINLEKWSANLLESMVAEVMITFKSGRFFSRVAR